MRRLWVVVLAVLLTGCASAPSASTPPATVHVQITLADGKAEPNGERLALSAGQTLVLDITSDRDDEVHVHGYDVEIEVAAGQTVSRSIVLNQVGRFEVESHHPPFVLLDLQVQ